MVDVDDVRSGLYRRFLARALGVPDSAFMKTLRVTTRNANFQQWQALLTNRSKRQRRGEFLVHGVRPITQAMGRGWQPRQLLYRDTGRLSRWARETLESTPAQPVAVDAGLLSELSEKDTQPPELIAVMPLPADDLRRVTLTPEFLGVVFDRPTSPGNIGTLIRSADAFGASAVVICGHAADPYDPKAVRASTGSLFSVPVVRVDAPRDVLDWLSSTDVRLAGTDEHGDSFVDEYDFRSPTLLAIGNETSGLSQAWREAVDTTVCIPMVGNASSLNAATAASIALYEAHRQRRPRQA